MIGLLLFFGDCFVQWEGLGLQVISVLTVNASQSSSNSVDAVLRSSGGDAVDGEVTERAAGSGGSSL